MRVPAQVAQHTVAAAASPRVAAALDGPPRPAEIVVAGPRALYVRDGATVLALLGRDAVAVPCGLRTRLAMLPVDRTVTLGDGRLVVGGHTVTVHRFVDVSVPMLGTLDRAAWPAADRALMERTAVVRGELPGAALDALRRDDPAAVPDLLGRGSGLTPVGDDVLAGWLAAVHATRRVSGHVSGRPARHPAGAVGDAVHALAAARTTAISAALLLHAIDGESVPQLTAVLLALRTGVGVTSALERLLAIGHTSGPGLALGMQLALDQRAERRVAR